MNRYVLIDIESNLVSDSLVWDGVTPWSPPDGFIAVQDDVATDGWAYAKGKFIAPPPPQAPEIPVEVVIAGNTSLKANLLASAALEIAPLQDAVDLGDATTSEAELLKAWKQYRVAVNRVDLSDPVWPEPPAA